MKMAALPTWPFLRRGSARKIMNQRIKIFVLSGFGSVCFGILCILFYSKPEYTPIYFSYDKYPHYQRQISDLLNDEFSLLGNPYKLDGPEIGIVLTDLNDDGTEEIIALVRSKFFMGTQGIETKIYAKDTNGLQLLSDGNMTFGILAVSKNKTNRYYDILSFAFGFLTKPDQKHTMAWTGSDGYTYIKSEPMSDKERKRFFHEEGL